LYIFPFFSVLKEARIILKRIDEKICKQDRKPEKKDNDKKKKQFKKGKQTKSNVQEEGNMDNNINDIGKH
jgi:hypothetical protein